MKICAIFDHFMLSYLCLFQYMCHKATFSEFPSKIVILDILYIFEISDKISFQMVYRLT